MRIEEVVAGVVDVVTAEGGTLSHKVVLPLKYEELRRCTESCRLRRGNRRATIETARACGWYCERAIKACAMARQRTGKQTRKRTATGRAHLPMYRVSTE